MCRCRTRRNRTLPAYYPDDPAIKSAAKAVMDAMAALSDDTKATMAARVSHITLSVANCVKLQVPYRSRLSTDVFGQLSKLTLLPMEIFFEIASALLPADLLAMSRVSKQFRAIFMSRNARLAWVEAFKNAIADLGLPVGCPVDMNEPQYASLIFDQLCSACNSVRASKVHFFMRLRFCSACATANLKQGSAIQRPSWMEQEKVQIWNLLPPMFQGWAITDARNNSGWNTYCVAEFNRVAQEYFDVRHDQDALDKYVKEREVMASLMMQHGLLLTRWHLARVKQRTDKRQEIIASERKSVTPRITRSAQKAMSVTIQMPLCLEGCTITCSSVTPRWQGVVRNLAKSSVNQRQVNGCWIVGSEVLL